MNFREYLNFLFGNVLRSPSIKGMAAAMIALSLGAVLASMFKKSGSQPEAQGRKAA
jgi:hypothetical protein